MLLHNDTPYPHVPALLYDARGNELLAILLKATFRLSRCVPVKLKAPALNAKDGIVAIEELQLAYESLELVDEDGGAP